MRYFYLIMLFFAFFTANNLVFSQDFNQPESVVYDALNDRYLVSAVGNYNTADGAVYQLSRNGSSSLFISSGLTDPKGMVIIGETLYLTDVRSLKAFDVTSGNMLFNRQPPSAQFLNDICADSSGNLFITDMIAYKIYKFNIESKEFEDFEPEGSIITPNGILYDNRFDRLVFVSYVSPGTISEVDLETMQVYKLKSIPYNYLDGITIDNLGNFIISAWGSDIPTQKVGSIITLKGNMGAAALLILNQLPGPADIFYNTFNDTLVIPLMNYGMIQYMKFGEPSQPRAPTLVFPSKGSSEAGPEIKLKWNFTSLALTYNLQVSENDEFDPALHIVNTSDTAYSFSDFEIGKTYYWRVNSENSAGTSEWSKTNNFLVAEPALITPTMMFPPSDTTCIGLYPTFKWTKSETNIYELQIDNEESFEEPRIVSLKISIDTVYKLETVVHLLKNAKYYWRVRTTEGSKTSDWPEAWNFSTISDKPPVPHLNTPFIDEEGQPLRTSFEWAETSNTDFYNMAISNDNFVNDSVIYEVEPESSIEIFQVPEDLESGKFYWWKVRSVNKCLKGDWTIVRKFKTKYTELSTPLLVYPANNGKAPKDFEFKWDAVEGAESYNIMVGKDVNFDDKVANTSSSENSIALSGVDWQDNETYYWKIKALNLDAESEWSPVYSFTIDPDLSVEEMRDFGARIYPNPAENEAVLLFGSGIGNNINIRIFNSLGMQINTFETGSNRNYIKLKLNDYEAGVYYIKISNISNNQFLKLIIAR